MLSAPCGGEVERAAQQDTSGELRGAGRMSFYTAARDGQIELLRELLDGGGDVNERFNDDRTAIHFA